MVRPLFGMKPEKVAVIGAGPAGLAAADALARGGVAVDVFEASGAVGGMCRSLSLWGQRVDLGPHRFFSADPRVNRLWLDVAGRDYRMVDRVTRIYYQGDFFDYPLSLRNVLHNIGVVESGLCFLSYLKEKPLAPWLRRDPGTFEGWVTRHFGRRLYEKFFRTYSEKLWGFPCRELDSSFARQRIRKFSLGEAFLKMLRLGGGGHKTLVDRFAYPLEGTGMIYERLACRLQSSGGALHLTTPVRGLEEEAPGVWQLCLGDRRTGPYAAVVSTMPLTLLVRGLSGVPAAVQEAASRLEFRNTILVYLEVEGAELFPDQWVYVHSPELRVGRITNFRNWAPDLCGEKPNTILALEYWCNPGDPEWTWDETEWVNLARGEMARSGLVGKRQIIRGRVHRIPRCYPVYRRGYDAHVRILRDYLNTRQGLLPVGRYGSFKYNNQDHSLLMGMLAAQKIMEGDQTDLWDLNSDTEYQENSRIDETGLVLES